MTGNPEVIPGQKSASGRLGVISNTLRRHLSHFRRVVGFSSLFIRLARLVESDHRSGLQRKAETMWPRRAQQSVLHSPVCLGIIAKYGQVFANSAVRWRVFSAVQTAWRSGVDSNLRYNSETRKCLRVRKLRRIRKLTRESTAGCCSTGANQCGFKSEPRANSERFCG
jgi:hypothetical protein